MPEYIINIPNWHPTPLNKLLGGHWSKAHKAKRHDKEILWGYTYNKIPEKQIKRSVELTIILGPGQRGCDPDAYWKTVNDGLVNSRALWNDNDKYCQILPVKFERAEKMATRIVITDLGDA